MNIRIDRPWRLARKGDRSHIPCTLRRLEFIPDPVEKIDARTWASPNDWMIGLPAFRDDRFLLTVSGTVEALDYLINRNPAQPLVFGPAKVRGVNVVLVSIALPKPKGNEMRIEIAIHNGTGIPKRWLQ